MTKTVCDICVKEMPTAKFVDNIEELNFCISSYGKIWDICTECRESLNRWMTVRRQGRSDEDAKTTKFVDNIGKSKCVKCGYECDDNYYIKNYCTSCGAKIKESEDKK